ncbi:sporulation protein YjcZ [Bacillus solitudinis]|nr:sporulation protein YjcZ [Bacillus solitudinis]
MYYYEPWYGRYCCPPPAQRYRSGVGFAFVVVVVILLIILGVSWYRYK